jgi:hypothetical protein
MICALATEGMFLQANAAGKGNKIKTADSGARKEVLRRDAVDIAGEDLFYGPGGSELAPPPDTIFTFDKEDPDGSNPKYVVHDNKGNKWKVKLGDEARPETVATRIVWAMGYYADEDYFLPSIKIQNFPLDVKRGRKELQPDGSFLNVRLKLESKDRKKIANWDWDKMPFTGTRELNGLRTLMAVINNWDLKTVNNAIFETKHGGEPLKIYEVSDLGASFGSPRFDLGYAHDKGDLEAYRKSKFILSTHDADVDFDTPGSPTKALIFEPGQYSERRHLMSVGRHIPRQDARWMGELLGQLTPKQIEDAFRAGGYSQDEANQFTTILQQRIAQLKAL